MERESETEAERGRRNETHLSRASETMRDSDGVKWRERPEGIERESATRTTAMRAAVWLMAASHRRNTSARSSYMTDDTERTVLMRPTSLGASHGPT